MSRRAAVRSSCTASLWTSSVERRCRCSYFTAARKRHDTQVPSANATRSAPRKQERGFACSGDRQSSREALRRYKKSFSVPPATHDVRLLSQQHVGTTVVLHGYLGARSDLSKKMSFVPLLAKDQRHSVQVISLAKDSDDGQLSPHTALKGLGQYSAVAVEGVVQQKEKPKEPPKAGDFLRNEEVEIRLTRLHILNEFPSDLTFQEGTGIAPELRHLQLRQRTSLRDALTFRSALARTCREYLGVMHGFVEVETPLLFKSTPEGAREFLVPTRARGLAYALPQSPQQYKQILMASGIQKYFQIAKCFRDEDLRADRQPEFTQLDLEMSFSTGKDVMRVVEDLTRHVWKELLGTELPREDFQRLPYQEAMAMYGSDKPDRRLGMKIMRIDYMIPVDLVSKIGPLTQPIVEAFKLGVSDEPDTTRRFVQDFMDSPEAKPFLENPEGQPGIFIYNSRKPLGGLHPFGFEAAEVIESELGLEEGDVLVIQARKDTQFSGGSTPLGDLRVALHRAAVAQGLVSAPTGWDFLWITDFPLFSPSNTSEPGQGGSAGFSSTHHPFTSPAAAADVDLVVDDPLSAKADHYDLVLNGVELGGGSRRIHDAEMQEYVLRDVLEVSAERMADFAHMLEVLRAGCPPHAGIALGFDRLCAVMLGRDSIRDVIAFPKSGRGEDLLVKSPSAMTPAQLETYHLQVRGRAQS